MRARRFRGVLPPLSLSAGQRVSLRVSHGDTEAHTLARAQLFGSLIEPQILGSAGTVGISPGLPGGGAPLFVGSWIALTGQSVPDSESRGIAVWGDGANVQAQGTGAGHGGGPGYQTAWSPDASRVAFAASDQGLVVINIETGQVESGWPTCITPGASTPTGPFSVSWSPDGSRLAVAEFNVRLWMIDTASRTVESGWPAYQCNALAFSPSGAQLAVTKGLGESGSIMRIINVATRTFAAGFEEITGTTGVPVAWSPDGSYVAVGRSGGGSSDRLVVWDTSTGNRDTSFPTFSASFCYAIGWSPNGQWLSCAAAGNTGVDRRRLINVAAREFDEVDLPTLPTSGNGRGTAWSLDSSRLAYFWEGSPGVMVIRMSDRTVEAGWPAAPNDSGMKGSFAFDPGWSASS